jgi:hypothetical protein
MSWDNICELSDYIKTTCDEAKDYNSTADALWKSAEAAFEYAANQLGCSGFQAEWAALTFYSKVLGIKCPIGVLRADDLLYPQYDIQGKVEGWVTQWKETWARERARELLAKHEPGDPASERVLQRWKELAGE